MNTDKRDSNGFKNFVLGFYPKIGVHPRSSVVEKEFSNSLLTRISRIKQTLPGDVRECLLLRGLAFAEQSLN
jgi:hypothetical protein